VRTPAIWFHPAAIGGLCPAIVKQPFLERRRGGNRRRGLAPDIVRSGRALVVSPRAPRVRWIVGHGVFSSSTVREADALLGGCLVGRGHRVRARVRVHREMAGRETQQRVRMRCGSRWLVGGRSVTGAPTTCSYSCSCAYSGRSRHGWYRAACADASWMRHAVAGHLPRCDDAVASAELGQANDDRALGRGLHVNRRFLASAVMSQPIDPRVTRHHRTGSASVPV
jgi:hypothetical protein